jgi:multiple sugar transport system permease protein
MKRDKKASKIIVTVVLAVLAFCFVLPLVWMICSSLKTTTEVFGKPFHWLPAVTQWGNYGKVWTDETINMLTAYGNTLKITLLGTAGQLIIASMAAYAFAKIDFSGKNAIFMLFLSSMMVPSQVTIIPRYMLFKTIGLYNNHWAIILPMWFGATAIFLLRQFYIDLPTDLMEAAKIDGAGHGRIFVQIMMPLTKPAMVSIFLLGFVSSWNEYLSPLIFLTDTKKFTISQAIRWYLLDDLQRYELTMAAATSAIIPVLILFLACQKYFVEGISMSGVKG